MADIGILVKRLSEAGLQAVQADRPFARGVGAWDIFGLDIQGGAFRIWPGAQDTEIVVTGIDREKKQAVLMVKESERKFEQTISRWMVGRSEIPTGARLLREEEDGARTYELTTPGQKRHFLMGVDERGSFIAQLPKGVSTVREAHEQLKSPGAARRTAGQKVARTGKAAKGRKGPGFTRQGEWFFMEIADDERKRLEEGLRKKTIFIERRLAIAVALDRRAGRGEKQWSGNPHVCDEVVVMSRRKPIPGTILHDLNKTLYVRGKVRHKEHATVEFKDWRRIERNAEVLVNGRASGITWVD